jgi:predicted O-methyltransferase YrrM
MTATRLTYESVRATATTGLMWEEELLLLHQMSRQADGPGALVEVGSWVGTSALVILAGQHEAGQERVRLFCIDNFEQATRDGFVKNLGEHLKSGEVTLLEGDSAAHASRWPADRPIKLLFLDGDHRYESVKREIELFEPHLLPGAVVLFHDAYYRQDDPARPFQVTFMYAGVARAIRRFIMPDRRYSGFRRACALLACRYHPDPAAHGRANDDRQAFVDSYERATAINTWPLRLAYLTYLACSGTKRLVRRLRLEVPIRFTLRKLGFNRLFGTRL